MINSTKDSNPEYINIFQKSEKDERPSFLMNQKINRCFERDDIQIANKHHKMC